MTLEEKIKWVETFDIDMCESEIRYYRETLRAMTQNGNYDTSHCKETVEVIEKRINKLKGN